MQGQKKTLLSGIKPTGRPHIGNYFGAMRQFVDFQNQYDTYLFVADYHALTSVSNPVALREDSLGIALDYLAIGIDPTVATLYKQSDVQLSPELAWIFSCLTTMPYLMRAHAFKDAEAKNKEINAGIFNYPMLMAADILLFNADVVPVGQDQKQHIEITRDTAEKFNRIYGETFALPTPLIVESVEVVPGTDGRKMSKSYGNHIPLFGDEDEVRKLIMGIVTDSKDVGEPKDPDTCNVFALHRLVSEKDLPDLERRYRQGGIGYKESKELLVDNLLAYFKPMRAYRAELAENTGEVYRILAEGAEKARARAAATMAEVRAKVGLM